MSQKEKQNSYNYDDIKKLMSSAVDLAVYIENMQLRIAQLEQKAQCKSVGGSQNLGTKILSGMGKVDDLYCTLITIKEIMAQKLILFEKQYRKIEGLIMQIEDVEFQMILDLRYLQGIRWSEIADRLGYSERNLFRVHNKALEAVGKILDGEK